MILRLLKFCFLLWALVFGMGASAQEHYGEEPEWAVTTTYTGRVVDSLTREALPAAVISVVTINNYGDKVIRNYLTDEKGDFNFKIFVGVQRRMEVASLGYKPLTVYLSLGREKDDLGQILLAQSSQPIDEVVVKARMQLYKMKGDTILFFPKAVKTMKDDPALEILRQMPGVEVGNDGSVKILGQTVERTYVNEKLLFGYDPTAALRELEAREVASIEAYDEVDEADAVAHGQNARKRKVLNIVTFKEFTQSYSAKARGEMGTDFAQNAAGERPVRYLASGNVNFYSESLQLALSGESNNLTMDEGGRSGRSPVLSRRSSNAQADVSGRSGDGRHRYKAGYSYDSGIERMREAESIDYFATEYFTSQHVESAKRNEYESDSHSLSGSYNFTGERFGLQTSLRARLSGGENFEQWSQRTVRDAELASSTDATDRSRRNFRSLDWQTSSDRRFKSGNSVSASIRVNLSGGEQRGTRLEERTTEGVQTPLGWSSYIPQPDQSVSANAGYRLDLGKAGNLSLESGVQYDGNTQRMRYTDLQTGLLDAARSEDAFDKTLTWNIGTNYLLQGEDYSFLAELKYLLENRVYEDYEAGSRDRRIFHFPTASLSYQYNGPKKRFSVSFSNSRTPVRGWDLSSRLDDSNPLYVRRGNRSLVPTKEYRLGFDSEFLGGKSSWGFSVDVRAVCDPIQNRRVFFAEETPLAGYDDYRMPAGSTLTTPENGAAYFGFQCSAKYKVPIAPLRLMLDMRGWYHFSNPQEQLYEKTGRMRSHMVTLDTRITTNFSSKFRIRVENSANLQMLNRFGASSREFRDVLKVGGECDLFGRLSLRAGYTGIFNVSSETLPTTDTNLLNLSLGCRVLKERGRIAFNAYDVLNDYAPIRFAQTLEGVSTEVNYVGGNYFTFSFEYKFNNRRAAN